MFLSFHSSSSVVINFFLMDHFLCVKKAIAKVHYHLVQNVVVTGFLLLHVCWKRHVFTWVSHAAIFILFLVIMFFAPSNEASQSTVTVSLKDPVSFFLRSTSW